MHSLTSQAGMRYIPVGVETGTIFSGCIATHTQILHQTQSSSTGQRRKAKNSRLTRGQLTQFQNKAVLCTRFSASLCSGRATMSHSLGWRSQATRIILPALDVGSGGRIMMAEGCMYTAM